MPLKHRCPSCGGPPRFLQDFGSGKKLVPWYKLAPVRNYCASCGADVYLHISSGIWAALPIWVLLCIATFVGIVAMKDAQTISRQVFQVGGFALLIFLYLGGHMIIRIFSEWKGLAKTDTMVSQSKG